MFQLHTGLSRRGFLRGGIGLGAFMLPVAGRSSQAAAKNSDRPRKAKSVIVLLLEGGMSHLDTWDLKPDAPAEIRGEFKQIATTNPGLQIGEHLPLLAKQAHRFNVIRSTHSAARNHSPGLHWILTGYDNPAAGVNGETVNNYPSVGSIVAHQLGSATADGLPTFVAVPNRSQLGGRVRFSGALHLGAEFEAFNSGNVPGNSKEPFILPAGLTLPAEVAASRLEDRRSLLKSIDELKRQRESAAEFSSVDSYQQQAFDLLLGDRGRTAFDLNQESTEDRQRYGESTMGQGALLARRLVEAGVNYVLVNFSRNNSWDTHRDNFNRLKKTLLPPMDRAVSALLADLEDRQMLDETLVLMMGEMGRTPIINKQGAGRDHWPDVYSVMMAGGGMTRGQILGSSTKNGAQPGSRPVHVQEVLATVYHQLGIDPHLMLQDRQNRPFHILPDSEPVFELIDS